MNERRLQSAQLNIITSLAYQFVALVCGLIVPRFLLGKFGSEVYGATTSILQFIAYISLLEGGVGGVARAALYKPLAEKNTAAISKVLSEIKRFFFLVGMVFLLYVSILSCLFDKISRIEALDWLSTFLLVWVISISTLLQYFVGLPYQVLLQADQSNYIPSILSIITTGLNALLVCISINLGCDIIRVKLISSVVYAIKPLAQSLYVKKKYVIHKTGGTSNYLEQKWTGLGQHIAYFLYRNTDVVVLTIFTTLKTVSVYSVYNMIISQIQNFVGSFSSGMEALFGEMLAKRELETLNKTFAYYETMISFVSIILFSTTAVMISPFVMLYTSGVNDANYYEPIFAFVLLLSSLVYCLKMPYHALTVAAGHFKQTKWAAYGEAVLNITLSLLLVTRYSLAGVASATLFSGLFSFFYYAIYLSKNILCRGIRFFAKRVLVNLLSFLVIILTSRLVQSQFTVKSYLGWILQGCIMFTIAVLVEIVICFIFYSGDFTPLMRKIMKR